MAFKNKAIETFRVRVGDGAPAGETHQHRDVTIRFRKVEDATIHNVARCIREGKDPKRYIGRTEFYTIIDVGGIPTEIAGDTYEEVKIKAIEFLLNPQGIKWQKKILVEVEWLLDPSKRSKQYPFGSFPEYAHNTLKYFLVRKAETTVGDYWSDAGNGLSGPPKLGYIEGKEFEYAHRDHRVVAAIEDSEANRIFLDILRERDRSFHASIGQILRLGEEAWDELVARSNSGEDPFTVATDILSRSSLDTE